MQLLAARSPLIVSVPHAGTELLAGQADRMTAVGRALRDTDWHVDKLADGLEDAGAGLIVARHSRNVIDLNRPPDDLPLYATPGSSLVPTSSFDGRAIYLEGEEPTADEVSERLELCWRPYHNNLEGLLDQARERYGHAVLLDLHSIASRVPTLFEGRLPDLSLGTFEGRSCDPVLGTLVSGQLGCQQGFTSIVNGRFKGGFITRHYGRPEKGVHALQLEIAQCCYMDEARPQDWDEARASALKSLIRELARLLIAWRPESR
ncbi:MAG: N-formylglutamate deformylase [Pseudomonadota bacterium]